jgi:hypothetical protein
VGDFIIKAMEVTELQLASIVSDFKALDEWFINFQQLSNIWNISFMFLSCGNEAEPETLICPFMYLVNE